jgi:hypothetical protein
MGAAGCTWTAGEVDMEDVLASISNWSLASRTFVASDAMDCMQLRFSRGDKQISAV